MKELKYCIQVNDLHKGAKKCSIQISTGTTYLHYKGSFVLKGLRYCFVFQSPWLN